MIRVFICSDVRIYREGLAEVLGRRRGIAVVGTSAGDGDRLDRVRELSADVVLLDMSTASSIAILRELTARTHDARVVALGVSETEPEIVAYAEAGVAGYVTRDQAIEDLIEAVVAVARGEAPCSPRAAAILLHRVSVLAGGNGGGRRAGAEGPGLTDREREILGLIRGGLSNKEIGQQLCIELPTVKNHVHNILEKLRRQRAARGRGGRPRADRVLSGPDPRAGDPDPDLDPRWIPRLIGTAGAPAETRRSQWEADLGDRSSCLRRRAAPAPGPVGGPARTGRAGRRPAP